MYISFVQNLKIWQCSVQNLFSSKGTKFFEDIFLLFFIENDYKWLKIYIPPQYRVSTTKFTLALLSGGLKWIFLPFKNNTLEFTDTKILHFSLSFKLVGQTSKGTIKPRDGRPQFLYSYFLGCADLLSRVQKRVNIL